MRAVEVVADVSALEREWEELADATHAVPFVRPGWIAAWYVAFALGEPQILAVRRGGRLTGVLALCAAGAVVRSASNWHSPEFGPLAEDAGSQAALARRLFAGRRDRVSLAFLDSEHGGLDALRAAGRAAGYRLVVRTLQRSPYLFTDGGPEGYEAHVDSKLRRDVRRRRRRLAEEGEVSVEFRDGSETLDELLAEGFAVEGSGWKTAQRTAIASRPETRAFYGRVGRWASERGMLRLGFVRVDGRAVAFTFSFEDDGVWYFLKGGYDPAFARFSPAKVLVHAMLERAFSRGLERFEFLGGADAWKLELTAACRDRLLLQAFAPSLRGRAEWVAVAGGRPLAKRIPGADRVVAWIRR